MNDPKVTATVKFKGDFSNIEISIRKEGVDITQIVEENKGTLIFSPDDIRTLTNYLNKFIENKIII